MKLINMELHVKLRQKKEQTKSQKMIALYKELYLNNGNNREPTKVLES